MTGRRFLLSQAVREKGLADRTDNMKRDLSKAAIVVAGFFMAYLSHYQILAPWGMAGWLLGAAMAGGGALAMYDRPVVGAILDLSFN
jgi:hypothetical protein